MLLRHIELRGIGGDWQSGDLDRVAALPAPPTGTAIGDALSILACTLDSSRFAPENALLGLPDGPDVLATAGLLDQVSWPTAARPGWLAADGKIGVQVKMELDPPSYGALREHAMRDTRLALALAEGPLIQLKIGWLFGRDRTVMSAMIHQLRVGETDLPVNGPERPAWVPGFLATLGARFGRAAWGAGGLPERLLAASLSPVAGVRDSFRALRAAFAAPPFAWGPLELIQTGSGVEIAFGPELVPLRQLGPDAPSIVALLEAIWLRAPDVLVVDRPLPPALLAWLAGRIEAEDATIEQLLYVRERW